MIQIILANSLYHGIIDDCSDCYKGAIARNARMNPCPTCYIQDNDARGFEIQEKLLTKTTVQEWPELSSSEAEDREAN